MKQELKVKATLWLSILVDLILNVFYPVQAVCSDALVHKEYTEVIEMTNTNDCVGTANNQ